MVHFYSDDNVTIDFRVVRAFPTSYEVREQYGIFANFSAKTVLITKNTEIELMSHNSLMLTNDNGEISISCPYKQDTWNDKNGRPVIGPKVYYTTIFPLSSELHSCDEDQYRQFMKQLVAEMKEFIDLKKKQAEERRLAASKEQPMLPF